MSYIVLLRFVSPNDIWLCGTFGVFSWGLIPRDPLGLVDCGVHPLLDGLVSVGTGEDWKPGRVWLEQWVQGVVSGETDQNSASPNWAGCRNRVSCAALQQGIWKVAQSEKVHLSGHTVCIGPFSVTSSEHGLVLTCFCGVALTLSCRRSSLLMGSAVKEVLCVHSLCAPSYLDECFVWKYLP